MVDSPKHSSEFDRELNYRGVLIFMVGLAAITALTFFGLWYGGRSLQEQMASGDPKPSEIVRDSAIPLPPAPLLQTEPYADMDAMRAAHDSVLHSYAVIDGARGIVRVPVTEAMDLIVKNGLPRWAAPNPTPTAPDSTSGSN